MRAGSLQGQVQPVGHQAVRALGLHRQLAPAQPPARRLLDAVHQALASCEAMVVMPALFERAVLQNRKERRCFRERTALVLAARKQPVFPCGLLPVS